MIDPRTWSGRRWITLGLLTGALLAAFVEDAWVLTPFAAFSIAIFWSSPWLTQRSAVLAIASAILFGLGLAFSDPDELWSNGAALSALGLLALTAVCIGGTVTNAAIVFGRRTGERGVAGFNLAYVLFVAAAAVSFALLVAQRR